MRKPHAERFVEKIDTTAGPDACWPWISARNARGYGVFQLYGRTRLAHRMVAHLRIGFLPRSLCVCHKVCDNPPCCNPAHLFVGTRADNTSDMVRKGRNYVARGECSGAAKLTQSQVLAIRQSSESQRALGRRYGVDHSTISRIRSGQNWKARARSQC
jgi:hypothetical protein